MGSHRLINQFRRISLATTCVVAVMMSGMVAPSFGQVVIFFEDFDPLSAGQNLQVGYDFGDTTASSSGIGAGAGLTGDSWQTVNTAAAQSAGFSGVGAQYQHPNASGNTSTTLSDYTLSFDARADGGSLNIQVETWADADFGGGFTGKLNTAPADPGFGNDQSLSASYVHYDLNLGDTNVFMDNTGIDMSGGTIQLTFQFNGSGSAPFTQTLDVDNLTLTMVPEPAAFVLLGLALPALALAARRRR